MEVHFRFFRIKKAGMYKTLSSIVFMSLIVCTSVCVCVCVCVWGIDQEAITQQSQTWPGFLGNQPV